MISPMKNTLMINTSNQNGFTLVELMIVIAIVGIIATVGYPSFINVSQSTYRTAGQSDLMAFAGAMEHHKLANYTYQGAAASGANTGAPTVFATYSPSQEGASNKRFNLTISSMDTNGTEYTITATPVTGGVMADNGVLVYFSDGRKAWDKNNNGSISADEYCWQC
jgi:type IV pilus assembly protein PilE